MHDKLIQLQQDLLAIKAKLLAADNLQDVFTELDNVLTKITVLLVEEAAKPIKITDETLLKTLTPREYEVAMHLKTGMCNKEIANVLDLNVRTVKSHLITIFQKLGARDRLQAVILIKG